MILGYQELSQRWGVTHDVLRQWKRRGILPEPDAVLGVSPGWSDATIREWEDNNKGRHNGQTRDGG